MTLSEFSTFAKRVVTGLVISVLALSGGVFAAPGGNDLSDRSDLNADGQINILDLQIFSLRYLEQNLEAVDWCEFHASVATGEEIFPQSTSFYLKHFGILLGFINDYYRCDSNEDLLAVVNQPVMLGRLAVSLDDLGNVKSVFATDPKIGSVFILDPAYQLVGELKHLDRPLGIAVDSNGYLLVGNDGRDNIEVYDPTDGHLLFTFGEGLLKMPTAITVNYDGLIYVTDSRNHNILVFDPSYILLNTIGNPGAGNGEFNFPMGVALMTHQDTGDMVTELYVADRNNNRIQVLDQQGNFISSFKGASFGSTKPKLTRIQAVAFDGWGRLHILDLYTERVEVIDTSTGRILTTYGAPGEGPGLLRLPADVLVTSSGTALVTDGSLAGLEAFTIPTP